MGHIGDRDAKTHTTEVSKRAHHGSDKIMPVSGTLSQISLKVGFQSIIRVTDIFLIMRPSDDSDHLGIHSIFQIVINGF